MNAGIVPNLSKKDIFKILDSLITKLTSAGIDVYLQKELDLPAEFYETIKNKITDCESDCFFSKSEIILSLGGDGTMLSTAYDARKYDVPLAGINIGKLGFLAEVNMADLDSFINSIKLKNYNVEDRMTIKAACPGVNNSNMFAVNDIVIDKGMWPKMIELTIFVDDEYVSTFTADGVIIATPTGSTGYALSTGGPIVFPKSSSIIISPIAPHTLTMRPLVLSSDQKINIRVTSQNKSFQVNCDGQRVHQFDAPGEISIEKSNRPLKLLHTKTSGYFEILREKLFWGQDIRQNSN